MVRKVSIKIAPKDQGINSKIALNEKYPKDLDVVMLMLQKVNEVIENGSELEIKQTVEQAKISINSTKLNDNQRLFVQLVFNVAKCRLANRKLKRLIEKM